jgi:glycosyltransferase involved in cell wall biosynthesis
MQPLLSIVIANYNYGRFLEEAIQSVLSQSCDDYELIIVDGGSTDNSVEIIKKYEDKIAWWESEKDKGQSDAFNKGFARAKGRFLTWLNADDVMLPGVIEKLKCAAEKHPKCEWFVGGVLWLDPEMKVINCGRGRPFSEIRYREGIVSVWGPSSFFTKRLLDAVGGVDERYHFTMDSELWLRFAYKLNVRYRPFVNYAWGLRMHKDAKMSGHNFLNQNADKSKNELDRLSESPHFAQMKQEELWMWEWFDPKHSTKFSRFLSASYLQVALAWLDKKRFLRKYYKEVFK